MEAIILLQSSSPDAYSVNNVFRSLQGSSRSVKAAERDESTAIQVVQESGVNEDCILSVFRVTVAHPAESKEEAIIFCKEKGK